jgi:predicted nucleotidyltransferase
MTQEGRTAEITDQMIVNQFRWYEPERIILFGSHARGQPAADIGETGSHRTRCA